MRIPLTLKTAWISPLIEGIFVIGLGASSGCAGPATPLGAIWSLQPQWQGNPVADEAGSDDSDAPVSSPSSPVNPSRSPSRGLASILGFGDRTPKIQFDPPHQWLHGAHSLKVIVNDPRGVRDDYGLKIRYHGHDVTRSFLMQAKVSRSDNDSQLTIEVPSIRLSPSTEHLIEVGYSNPDSGLQASSKLRAPICREFDRRDIHNFDEFHPAPHLTQSIDEISRQMGFNPAFTAALIAQESAFNSRSVSFARAVGLTQVTPLAEEEVTGQFPRWPRYPGMNQMPAPILKWLIMSGEINAGNEWRLSPDRSIRGGLAFAQRLADRWLDSQSFSKVSWTGRGSVDAEVARTKLVLASYNSGYTRVQQAISHYGTAWLTAPELKEARRYVNRIFSYCDAFEHRRAGDEPVQRARAPRGPEWPLNPKLLPPALIQKVMHENQT